MQLEIYDYDYYRRKGFYNRLSESVDKLDKAYLVLETMETPGFLEGEIISEILYEIDKTTNDLSDNISKDLQKRGMKFVGSTIIYSYLQAIGIIYSHEKACYLFKK